MFFGARICQYMVCGLVDISLSVSPFVNSRPLRFWILARASSTSFFYIYIPQCKREYRHRFYAHHS